MINGNAYREPRLPMAPKAVAALIWAIAACEWGWCYGVPGIVLGVISRKLSRRARAIFEADPLACRGEKIIRAAEKWSRIGLIQGIILTVVTFIIFVLYVVLIAYLVVSQHS